MLPLFLFIILFLGGCAEDRSQPGYWTPERRAMADVANAQGRALANSGLSEREQIEIIESLTRPSREPLDCMTLTYGGPATYTTCY